MKFFAADWPVGNESLGHHEPAGAMLRLTCEYDEETTPAQASEPLGAEGSA